MKGLEVVKALEAYAEELEIKMKEGLKEDKTHTSNVEHPSHYNKGKFEVIEVIEDWNLNFHLGNTIKYIARAKHKNNELEDLNKALWYLKREIERIKSNA